jgi:hypothetical protein
MVSITVSSYSNGTSNRSTWPNIHRVNHSTTRRVVGLIGWRTVLARGRCGSPGQLTHATASFIVRDFTKSGQVPDWLSAVSYRLSAISNWQLAAIRFVTDVPCQDSCLTGQNICAIMILRIAPNLPARRDRSHHQSAPVWPRLNPISPISLRFDPGFCIRMGSSKPLWDHPTDHPTDHVS